MTKKVICAVGIVVLAICLLSGGCYSSENNTVKAWKDLLKISPDNKEKAKDVKDPGSLLDNLKPSSEEKVTVELYFKNSDGKVLVVEKRAITKTPAIARKTLEELIKGPQEAKYLPVFPRGTRLLDINIKPEGLCIVDFSSEIRQVSSPQEEQLMIQAIANTLGQFPAINGVSFMINGEKVDSISNDIDLSNPVEPDSSIKQL